MKVKLLDYLLIDTLNSKKQKRNTRMSGLDNMPLSHSICGKKYFPLDLIGNFQEVEVKHVIN